MNKSNFLQELNLLFLSVILSGLAASDYLVKHNTPLDLPESTAKIPKLDVESSTFFGIFNESPRSLATDEHVSCTVATDRNHDQNLSC